MAGSLFTSSFSRCRLLVVQVVVLLAGLQCAQYNAQGLWLIALLNGGQTSSTISMDQYQLLAADNASLSTDITGTIDPAANTIAIALPLTADFSSLIATFSTSNAGSVTVSGVSQTSGVTANSFVSAPAYTLTGSDGLVRGYQIVRTVDASDGLIHYWPFSGSALDSTGGINGTVNGATLTADRQGNASQAYLYGGDVNITMASAPALTSASSWTYSVWVRVDAFGAQATSTGAGDGDFILDRTPEANPLVNLKISHTNRFVAMYRDDAGGSLTQMVGPLASIGAWAHLVYVRDSGTQFRLYVNANPEASSADAIGALTPPTPVVGDHVSGASKFFTGAIDELRIYNRALSATEISNMYNYLD